MKKKTVSIVLALVLVCGAAVGGSLAWLTDKTDDVVNTFTVGKVDLGDLTETTGTDYKMVPGNTITKDPSITVNADSEACYLFVKVAKSENFDSYMTYDIAAGWTELEAGSGIYYRTVETSKSAQTFQILKNDQVKVKADVEAGEGFSAPTLTFTGYACQKDNVATPAAAWEILNPTPKLS